MFEKASRLKLRFQTPKGYISVEDLWDLSLTALNLIAIDCHNATQNTNVVSFLEEQPTVDPVLELKLEIIKHIIKTRLGEADAKKEASQKQAREKYLLGLLEKQRVEKDLSMTAEEIEKELAALKS